MSQHPMTSERQQGDEDLSAQSPALDEEDDTEGHLMIRTDDVIAMNKKEHGSPRRS